MGTITLDAGRVLPLHECIHTAVFEVDETQPLIETHCWIKVLNVDANAFFISRGAVQDID
jgi:hypothetical protein